VAELSTDTRGPSPGAQQADGSEKNVQVCGGDKRKLLDIGVIYDWLFNIDFEKAADGCMNGETGLVEMAGKG
jgi:hypothetical protein